MKIGEYRFVPTISEAVDVMMQLAKQGIDSDMRVLDSGWALVRALKGEEDDEADMPMQDLPTEGMR